MSQSLPAPRFEESLFGGRALIEHTDPRSFGSGRVSYAFERRRRPLWPGGPFVSSIGFGAQRLRLPRDQMRPDAGGTGHDHLSALRHALQLGVNFIDTRAADPDGQSELVVGRVLQDCLRSGTVRREGVVLMGKVGDFRGHDFESLVAWERAGRRGSGASGASLFLLSPDHCFSFSEDVIRTQIARSLARLGLACLDVVLLENPENAFRSILRTVGERSAAAEIFQMGLVEAFTALKKLCNEGVIGGFGVGSNAFVMPSGAVDRVPLEWILRAADGAQSREHLKLIALPLNWIEVGGLLGASEAEGSLLEQAQASGLGVVAQRPLNALCQGQLIRLARPRLDEQALRDLSTDKQRGLENWARLARDLEEMGRSHIQSVGYEDAPLSQLAVAPLVHLEGVSSVLVGMRRPFYVEDMLECLARPVMLRAKDVVLGLHSQLEFQTV